MAGFFTPQKTEHPEASNDIMKENSCPKDSSSNIMFFLEYLMCLWVA
jgi:hypothetical protein